jgi:hypothetical protein
VTLTDCLLKVKEQQWFNDWDDKTKGYYRHGRAIHAYHSNLTLTRTEVTRDTTLAYPDTDAGCAWHWSAGVYYHCSAWWTTDISDRVPGTLTLNNVNIHDLICHGVESYESEGTVMDGGRIERNGRREHGGWGLISHTKFTPRNNPVISDNQNGLYLWGGYSSPQVVYDHPTLSGLTLANNRYYGLLTYFLNLELTNCQITGSVYPYYNHGWRYWRIGSETEDGGGQTALSTIRLSNCVLTGKRRTGNYWSRNASGVWVELPYDDIGYCSINYHSNFVATDCDVSGGADKETWHGLLNYGHKWWNTSTNPDEQSVGNTVQVKNCQIHDTRWHGLYGYRTGKMTLDGGSVRDNGVEGSWESWSVYANEIADFETKNSPVITRNSYGLALVGRMYSPQDRYDTINLTDLTIESNLRTALTVQNLHSTLSNVTLNNNGYGLSLYGFRYWSYPSGQLPPEVEGAKVTINNCAINNNKKTYTNADGSTYDYGWGINNYHTQLTVANSTINNNGYYGMLNYGHNWWSPASAKVPKSGVVVTNSQVIGNRHHGIHGHLADVSVVGCTVTGDGSNAGHGVYVYDGELGLGAGNSIERWHVGASLYASYEWHQRPWGHAHAPIENVTIQNNFGYGLIVQGRSLAVNNCTFTNNGVYGIYIHGHPYWTRDANGDGTQDIPPRMQESVVNINNTAISGNTNWSIVNYHGTVNFNNSSITTPTGYGIYSAGHNWWEPAPSGKAWNEFPHTYDFIGNLTLNNSQVTANNSWGVHATWQRALTLNNSRVANTSYIGVYHYKPVMFDTTPGQLTLNNTAVTGHASYGIYSEQTKLALDAASAAQLTNNYHGLAIVGDVNNQANQEFALADMTIAGNRGIGVLAYRVPVNFQRITIENNVGQGLYVDGYVASSQPYTGSVTLSECNIRNNGSYGMQVNVGGAANIQNCRFEGNDHGAIVNAAGINMQRCDVRANWRWGVQVEPKTGTTATLKNVVIADNANGIWYAPADRTSGDLQLWNCTIASNNDTYGRGYYTAYGLYQGAGTATVRNCIFKDSPSYGVYRGAGSTSVSHTLFHGIATNLVNVTAGDKVLTRFDPQFENPATGDYHLKMRSRAIGAGLSAPGVVDLDREGRPRPMYGKWELGAYEFPDKSGVRFIESWNESATVN